MAQPRLALALVTLLLATGLPQPAAALTAGEVLTNVTQLADGLTTQAFLFRNIDGSLRSIDRSETLVNNATQVHLRLTEDDASPFRVIAVTNFLTSTKSFVDATFEVRTEQNAWTIVTPRITATGHEVTVSDAMTAVGDTFEVRITETHVPWTLNGLLAGTAVFGKGSLDSVWLNRTDSLWWSLQQNVTTENGGFQRVAFTFNPALGRSNYGAPVAFNKTWMNQTFGLTNPYFEWGHGNVTWKPLVAEQNATHWIVTPTNFSTIGAHDPVSGLVDGTIRSYTDELSTTLTTGGASTTETQVVSKGSHVGYYNGWIQGQYQMARQRFQMPSSGYVSRFEFWQPDFGCWGENAMEIYSDSAGAMGSLIGRSTHSYTPPQGTYTPLQPGRFYNETYLTGGNFYWWVAKRDITKGTEPCLGYTSSQPSASGNCQASTDGSAWTDVGLPCIFALWTKPQNAISSGGNFIAPLVTTHRLAAGPDFAGGAYHFNSWDYVGEGWTQPAGGLVKLSISLWNWDSCGYSTATAYLYQMTGFLGTPTGSAIASWTVAVKEANEKYFDPPLELSAGHYGMVLQLNNDNPCYVVPGNNDWPDTWTITSGQGQGFGNWNVCQSCSLSTSIVVAAARAPTATVVHNGNQVNSNTERIYGVRATATGSTPSGTNMNTIAVLFNTGEQLSLTNGAGRTTLSTTASSTSFVRTVLTTSGVNTPTWTGGNLYYTGEIKYVNSLSRSAGSNSETDTLSINPTASYSNAIFKAQVSSKTQGITSFTFQGSSRTETTPCPASLDSLASTRWCYDLSNFDVYYKAGSIAPGTTYTTAIQTTWGGTFDITVPGFVRAGDYIMTIGVLKDANGNPINAQFGSMEVIYASNGTSLPNNIGKGPTYYVQNGNFFAIQTTNYITPGQYKVQISFLDAGSGITIKKTYPITIGNAPIGGGGGGGSTNPIFTDAVLHYTYFDNRSGVALEEDFYKFYISTDTVIDEGDRVTGGKIPVVTGNRYYLAIKDYFNHQVFPTTPYYCTGPNGVCPLDGSTSTYAYLDIDQEQTFVDIGVTLYQVKMKNTQTDPAYVEMTANGKTYQTYVLPGEVMELRVPFDTYFTSVTMYDANDPSRVLDYTYNNTLLGGAGPYWMPDERWSASYAGQPANPGNCLDASAGSYCERQAPGSAETLNYFGTIDLGKVVMANRFGLHLYDGDARYYYGYRIQVNDDPDHNPWRSIWDSSYNGGLGGYDSPDATTITRTGTSQLDLTGTNRDYRGPQTLTTSNGVQLPVRYMRIFGTQNTVNAGTHLMDVDVGTAQSTSIVANKDTFLWIRGYDLYSVVFAINNVNSLIYDQQVNVGVHIMNQDSTILQQTANIAAFFNNTNTFIGTQLVGMYSGINNTNSNINFQTSLVQQNINNFQSNITSQVNGVSQNVSNFQTSITTQLNGVSQSINNFQSNISAQINLVNQNITNVGVNGIPDEPALVLHYPMTATATTVVDDVSRSNLDGTLNTFGSPITYVPGKTGDAVDLDGSNDFISRPDAAAIDIARGSFTAWIFPDSNAGAVVLVKEGAYSLNIGAGVAQFVGQVGGQVRVAAGSGVVAGQWNHIAGTYDGAVMRVYVNGVQVGIDTIAGSFDLTTGALHIGRNIGAGDHFDGRIDEVRIYNRALSAEEVKAHHMGLNPVLFNQFNVVNVGISNTNVSIQSQVNALWTSVNNTNVTLSNQINYVNATVQNNGIRPPDESALEVHLPFDTASGGVSPDESGKGRPGTLTNGASLGEGQFDQGLVLDGADDYAQVPSVPATKFTGQAMSIEAFARIDADDTTDAYIFSKPWGGCGVYNYYLVRQPGNKLVSITMQGAAGTSVNVAGPIIEPGVWYHYAVTMEPSTRTLRLYVNGTLRASGVWPSANDWNPGGGCGDQNYNLIVGGLYPYGAGSLPQYMMKGRIDDFRVYSRTLSADDVLAHANGLSPSLMTQFNFISAGVVNSGTSISTQVNGVWNTINNTGSNVSTQLNVVNTTVVNTNAVVQNQINALSSSVNNTNASLSLQLNHVNASVINNGLRTPGDAHLVGYWPLDEVEGTKANDAAERAGDGVLVSMAETIDTTASTVSGNVPLDSTTWYLSQGFVVNKPTRIDGLCFRARQIGSPTGTATFRIGTDLGGIIGGGQATKDANTFPTGSYGNACVTGIDASLTPGTTYYASIVYSAGSTSGGNFLQVAQVGDAYAGGNYASSPNGNPSSWTNVAADLGFRVSMPESLSAWKSGRISNGLSFDGVDDRVVISNTPFLQARDGLTLEAWVRPTVATGTRPILWKHDSYGLWQTGGSLVLTVYTANGGRQDLTVSSAVAANQWTHALGTYDGATMRLYVNGVLAGTQAKSGLIVSSTSDLHIGRSCAGCSNEFFAGTVDEARVYDRALASDEAVASYHGIAPLLFTQINLINAGIQNTNTTVTTQTNVLSQRVANVESNLSSQMTFFSAQVENNNTLIQTQFNVLHSEVRNTEGNITNQTNLVQVSIQNLNNSVGEQLNGVNILIQNNGIRPPDESALQLSLPFEETSGTVAQDAGRYNRDGMLQNMASTDRVNGKEGFAVQLDGVDDYIRVEPASGLYASTFTVSMWVDLEEDVTYQTLFRQPGAYYAYVRSDGVLFVQTSVDGSVQPAITSESNVVIASKGWQHVAVTYDGSVLRAYVDGAQAAVGARSYSPIAGALLVGSHSVASYTETLKGRVDQVRVYSRALEASEIAAHYQGVNPVLFNQVNAIQATIANSNLSIASQVNLVWAAVNNTNSTITTQISGVNARIDVFHSNVNNSFAVVRSDISYSNTTILNNISAMNATLFAKMVGILDDAAVRGSEVFNQTSSILANVTTRTDNILSGIDALRTNVTGAVFNQTASVLANLTNRTDSIFVGIEALRANVTANVTTAIGTMANATVRIDATLSSLAILLDVGNESFVRTIELLTYMLENASRPGFITVPVVPTNDTRPPSSVITAEPSIQEVDAILVRWAATDQLGQVAWVDIYARRIGTDWAFLAQFAPRSGEAVYRNVVPDGKYEFKSIARDVAGNIEPDPTPGSRNYANLTYVRPNRDPLPFEPQTEEEARGGVLRPLLVPGVEVWGLLAAVALGAMLARRRRG